MLGTLRAYAFQAAFYVWTLFICVAGLPLMVLPRHVVWTWGRLWGRGALLLMRLITGTRLEVRGLENLPDGPCIVASKHQSALETLALYMPFSDPTYILKKELVHIPVFGWWMRKFKQIPIDRKKGRKVADQMIDRGREAVAEGRQVLIFPEGTRKRPGEAANYKYGVTRLYAALDVPCVPVALNAGVFWPRRQVAHFPGTTVLHYLPPIPPGLSSETFAKRLVAAIETGSDALLLEAAEAGVPLSDLAQARVAALRAPAMPAASP